MFFPSERPADPECKELRALHRAMNTPVVAIERLPVGPASAAIALHADPGEGVSLTIAIRSVRTGQTLFFTPDEDLLELGSSSVALDAALSFAESMGFLFDDDEVGSRGPRGPAEAARLWREFIDEGGEADLPISLEEAREAASARAKAAPAPPKPPGEPLWLSEPLEPPEQEPVRSARRESPAGEGQRTAPPAPASPPPVMPAPAPPQRPSEGPLSAVLAETSVERLYAAPPPRPRLTKFRGAPAARARAAPAAAARIAGPADAAPPAAAETPQTASPDLRIRLLSRF